MQRISITLPWRQAMARTEIIMNKGEREGALVCVRVCVCACVLVRMCRLLYTSGQPNTTPKCIYFDSLFSSSTSGELQPALATKVSVG